MANSQSPLPASTSRELPPVTVDGHALFEFSLKMNRALKQMETRFGATEKARIPLSRFGWQQLPKKPR
ncbi:MAG: hypothetical protein SH868_03435 [Bythopirellula sp.]|nr:hypothetical protein [Bythopirellula sp.]